MAEVCGARLCRRQQVQANVLRGRRHLLDREQTRQRPRGRDADIPSGCRLALSGPHLSASAGGRAAKLARPAPPPEGELGLVLLCGRPSNRSAAGDGSQGPPTEKVIALATRRRAARGGECACASVRGSDASSSEEGRRSPVWLSAAARVSTATGRSDAPRCCSCWRPLALA